MCLVDSGATHSFINANIAAQCKLPLLHCSGLAVTLANGTQVTTKLTCEVPMHFNANLMHLVTCHVVNNLTSSVVLGIDWLMEHRPEIDWPNYTVTLHLANGKRLLIPGLAAGNSKPTFVFCSSKVACKLVAKGEHAWLILISPDNSAACLHGAKCAQANQLSVHR